MNLLADMGVQPGTLQIGADPAKPLMGDAEVDRHRRADLRRHRAGRRRDGRRAAIASTISGTATDSGGGIVAGVEVSVDGGTTWHPAQGADGLDLRLDARRAGAGDDSHSRDRRQRQHRDVPGSGVTVTVVAGTCPCPSLFSASSVPAIVDAGDDSPVELGLKFRSDVDGFVTGVRFYKSAGNSGTHIGNLWSSTGTLLATATFTAESPSGWQEVLFNAPVAVTANTTYVVSYHTNVGHYSASGAYFASQGIDRSPLHAPPSAGRAGGNGVFQYGAAASASSRR